MARVVVQPVWQQKHPTPSHGGWEFHFHPSSLSAAVTEKIVAMDVGLAGGPLAAWAIEPGLAIWIRSFVATVTSEQRRYTGLAGVVVAPAPGEERGFAAALPGVLGAARLPAAAPWVEGASSSAELVDAAPSELARLESWAPFAGTLDVARTLAHAVVLGGPCPSPAPVDDHLSSLFGDLLSWMPAESRCEPRRGTFVEGGAARAPTREPSSRNLLHYLARGWVPSAELTQKAPDFGRHVWRLVAEVVGSTGGGAPATAALFDELTEIAESWDAALDLERYLRRRVFSTGELVGCDARAPSPLFAGASDAGVLWNRVLHYWGRGFLAVPDARIAGLLARRILVDHLFHLDSPKDPDLPRRYLRRLVYEAMLPEARVKALLAALGKIMPTLFEARRGIR